MGHILAAIIGEELKMRYTLPKDTELTAKVIKDAINYNEKRRKRFDLLDCYYIGD